MHLGEQWRALRQIGLPFGILHRIAARDKYSKIWGAWTGEFPQPNEWIHLWRYKNLQERFEARGAAMKDPAWQAYLAKGPAKLAEMHSTLLMPTNYSPLK